MASKRNLTKTEKDQLIYQAKEHFRYDKLTGNLIRIKSPRLSCVNKVVGTLRKDGDLVVGMWFMGRHRIFQVTNLIWILEYERLPYQDCVICHKDEDKTNNKIDNLVERTIREVTIRSHIRHINSNTGKLGVTEAVSYTHLTLPTICSV